MKNDLNKKAFTLVEILVTIGLLALIGVGIGVSLNKVLKNQEENSYESFIEKIKSSTLLYSSNSAQIVNDLEYDYGYKLISMKELINEGYVKGNLKNPNTNEVIKDFSQVDEVGKEDYSHAKVYYTMDKEMVIEYPYIKPSEESYLNVINYTTMYKSKEDDLCYKGINTPGLGLTIIQKDGVIRKDLTVGTDIIAYMEDGSTCTDSILNTSKVGTYKIRYIYTVDGSNALNNPNAKSAVRNITVKPTKPKIEIFEVKYKDDISNSNFDPYNLKLSLKANEPVNVSMKYCLVAVDGSQNDSDISKLISNCKEQQNGNQINNYWTNYPSNNTVNISFNVKESLVELKDARALKFYIFVKNGFEEFDKATNSYNDGIIYLYKTVTLNANGGKFSDGKTLISFDTPYGTPFNIFMNNHSAYKTPTRGNDYDFDGWISNGNNYTNDTTTKIREDITLLADWYHYCDSTHYGYSSGCNVSCGYGQETDYYVDSRDYRLCYSQPSGCYAGECPTTTTAPPVITTAPPTTTKSSSSGAKKCISPVSKQYKHECDCYMGDGIPMLIWYDSTYCYCCRSSY